MEFKDDTFIIATANDNVLVGIKRHYDENSQLAKITSSLTGINTDLLTIFHLIDYIHFYYIGEVFIEKEPHHGFFMKDLGDAGRVLVTKNFSDLSSCIRFDKDFLVDCFALDAPSDLANVNVDGCRISFDIGALSKLSEDNRDKFKYSLKQNEIKLYKDIDGKIPCPDSDDWNKKSIRNSLESWFHTLQNGEALWFLESDPEPLDPSNPVIDIHLDHYKNRSKHQIPTRVKIVTISGEELWRGYMDNGRIQGRVHPDRVDHPGWKSRITLSLNEGSDEDPHLDKVGQSLTAVEYNHYLTGSLRHGKLHGLVLKYGVMPNDPEGHCAGAVLPGLAFVGRYDNGKLFGHAWRGLTGGSWIYGDIDESGEFTGKGNVAFIYQDLETAVVGTFKNGIMVSCPKSFADT